MAKKHVAFFRNCSYDAEVVEAGPRAIPAVDRGTAPPCAPWPTRTGPPARRPGLRSCVVVEAGTGGLPGTRTEADHLGYLVGPSPVSAAGASRWPTSWPSCPATAGRTSPATASPTLPTPPTASGLDVTGDGGDALTVAAVSRLQLDHGRARVPRRCDTARSGPVLADEVITLPSAFQLAGYRQVVGTLWPVLDTVAVRFARRVYGTVATAGARRAARAVHAAVLDLRRRHPDLPSVWAALCMRADDDAAGGQARVWRCGCSRRRPVTPRHARAVRLLARPSTSPCRSTATTPCSAHPWDRHWSCGTCATARRATWTRRSAGTTGPPPAWCRGAGRRGALVRCARLRSVPTRPAHLPARRPHGGCRRLPHRPGRGGRHASPPPTTMRSTCRRDERVRALAAQAEIESAPTVITLIARDVNAAIHWLGDIAAARAARPRWSACTESRTSP